jgi:hypothetical protein
MKVLNPLAMGFMDFSIVEYHKLGDLKMNLDSTLN